MNLRDQTPTGPEGNGRGLNSVVGSLLLIGQRTKRPGVDRSKAVLRPTVRRRVHNSPRVPRCGGAQH